MNYKGKILITRKNNYETGTIHCIKDKYVVTNYKDDNHITIEFIDTSFTETFSLKELKRGNIKDTTKITVLGMGCLGEDYYKLTRKYGRKAITKIKDRWRSMLMRCYCEKDNYYYLYGGSGVTVCDRWFNFSNYFNDLQNLDGWDYDKYIKGEITIDKDKLQQGKLKSEMVYSKETCCLLTYKEQNKYIDSVKAQQKRMKPFILITPEGEEVYCESLHWAERKYGLHRSVVAPCLKGEFKQYKGYTFRNITD